MRRRSRTSHGSNEMRQRAVRRAPRGANPGTTDPPRCGHATPLSITAARGDGHAHVQVLRSILGSASCRPTTTSSTARSTGLCPSTLGAYKIEVEAKNDQT